MTDDPEPEDRRNAFVPVRRASVSETEVDGEVVLLEAETGAMHVLNPIAAAVWSALDGVRDVSAITDELSTIAGADPATVGADVTTFLRELGRMGLLLQAPPENEPSRRGAGA